MRIAITYPFHDKDWLGGRNYFASLFSAIQEVAPEKFEVILVMGKKTISTLPNDFPWIEVLRTPLLDRLHPAWLVRQLTLRKFENDFLLGRFLVKHRIDLLSHSGYLGRSLHIKTLPWLTDFQYMHVPECWTSKQISWIIQRYKDACKYGDAIVVSSEDARRDLNKFSPELNKPCYVLQFVSNPVDFEKLPSEKSIRQKYNLADNYLHLPNQFWANKNHRLVIDALAILKQGGIEITVVCTGKTFDPRMPNHFHDLMEYCKKKNVINNFRVLGLVPQSDLQGLMAYSAGVINPSRFEGWSTSVEEAKTLQKPLLLSDLAVHREQAPILGQFFSVDDPLTLASIMNQVVLGSSTVLDIEKINVYYKARLRLFGQHYVNIVSDLMRYH